jgi:NTE family protein
MNDIIEKFFNKIGANLNRHYYQNLVFKGGGMKGVAYLGAIEAIEEVGILQNITRVAGTSVGAISALLVSISKDSEQIRSYFNSLDHTKIPQAVDEINDPISKIIPLKVPGSLPIQPSRRLSKKFGWYSSEYFYNWLQEIIESQCGDGRATFKDFQNYGFRDLYVTATNLSKHRGEMFSAEHTPNVAVADAVRMSMSIPLFFNALQFDGEKFGEGDYYVDGGVYDNFPMHVFDDRKYVKYNGLFKLDINYETLGLYLYPHSMKDADSGKKEPQKPLGLMSYLELLTHNLYNAQQIAPVDNSRLERDRTIQINDCGVSAVNFNMTEDSEEYKCLEKSGYNAVMEYFTLIP